MKTMVTRRNAGKEKTSSTPTTAKSNKNEKDTQESEISDTEPNLNLDSLSSEQKLDFLCKRVDELTFFAREIKSLKKSNEEKDQKIKSLEQKIESLEQYTRRDDVVISGFDQGPVPLSRIVGESVSDEQNGSAPQRVQDTLEDKLVTFLNTYDIPIKKEEISACHTLGKREHEKKQPIVVRFVSRKTKTMMLANGYKLKDVKKPGGVYINEHLSKKNSELARKAMRKSKEIISTWTRDCNVFVRIEHGDGNTRIVKINDMADLDRFDSEH